MISNRPNEPVAQQSATEETVSPGSQRTPAGKVDFRKPSNLSLPRSVGTTQPPGTAQTELIELRVRVAALESENAILRDQRDDLRDQRAELREQLPEAQPARKELFQLASRERLPAPGWWARLFGKG